MLLAVAVLATTAPKFPLTIESIMRGPALVGHSPQNLRWSPDGATLTFAWGKADGTTNPKIGQFQVNRDGTGLQPEKPAPASTAPSDVLDEPLVYSQLGDLYQYDPVSKKRTRLTDTPEMETDPVLVDDGHAVVYVVGLNVAKMNLANRTKVQLTQVSVADSPLSAPSAVQIKAPSGYRARSCTLFPKGEYAYIEFVDEPPTGRRAGVPNYLASGGYPEMIQTYQRVGAPQGHNQGVLVALETKKLTPVSAPRPGRISSFRWSSDGGHAYAVERSEDHKDQWIVGLNAKTGAISTLWDEHCDAWIGGPGRGVVGWYPDGSRIYFLSEKNGFSNLYTMSPEGGEPTALVGGNFEVSDLRLDAKRNRFTYVSSEGSPFVRHLDAINLDGSGRAKLATLSEGDDSSYAIAPNGTDVAVVRSSPNRPAELFVNNVQVTTTPTEEWLSGLWINPPVVMIPSTDGVSVPARVYKPKGWRRGGPAVIFVHGAGYLQNVYDGWSHYYREYMFHHYLMDHGYEVLDMDYRGSAGYGRDWRTAIYRHMGGKDLDDEVAGAQWLVNHEGAGKDRLGIYGGSYGGFMTLMAMFTKPDVFAAGAALRPVADWASYNIGYSGEILNLPQNDAEAYRISSPINFVDGLKGALLICHGMVDTNVTFQDSVRVTEKLIELGKTNWEIAPYPAEDHDFQRPTSWTDEYRRIFELFERTIGPNRRK